MQGGITTFTRSGFMPEAVNIDCVINHSLPVCRPSHSDGFVLNYSCLELWIGVIKSQYYLI